MNAAPQDILDKLPKRTPLWAVGLVSSIVSLAVSFVVVYPFIKGEVQQYMASSANIEEKRVEAEVGKDKADRETLKEVLKMVNINMTQLTSLATALSIEQQNSMKLIDRVSVVERELAVTRAGLESCMQKLKK